MIRICVHINGEAILIDYGTAASIPVSVTQDDIIYVITSSIFKGRCDDIYWKIAPLCLVSATCLTPA